MSRKSSDEMSRDNLLPADDHEKDGLYAYKPTSISRIHHALCKRRFHTSGVSLLHYAFAITFFVTLVYVAYEEGVERFPPRNYESFVPQIRPAGKPVVFTDSADWSGNTSRAAAGWDKWLKNFDTHTIAIPHSSIEKFSYEPGLPDTKHSQRFGIAMFHQLHCLATIREFAYLPDAMRMPDGKPLDHDGVTFSTFHMDHCFNYLRQAIECYADSTVEWAKVNKHGQRQGIQGWGIPHYECRDRDTLEAFAVKHHNIPSN